MVYPQNVAFPAEADIFRWSKILIIFDFVHLELVLSLYRFASLIVLGCKEMSWEMLPCCSTANKKHVRFLMSCTLQLWASNQLSVRDFCQL